MNDKQWHELTRKQQMAVLRAVIGGPECYRGKTVEAKVGQFWDSLTPEERADFLKAHPTT